MVARGMDRYAVMLRWSEAENPPDFPSVSDSGGRAYEPLSVAPRSLTGGHYFRQNYPKNHTIPNLQKMLRGFKKIKIITFLRDWFTGISRLSVKIYKNKRDKEKSTRIVDHF